MFYVIVYCVLNKNIVNYTKYKITHSNTTVIVNNNLKVHQIFLIFVSMLVIIYLLKEDLKLRKDSRFRVYNFICFSSKLIFLLIKRVFSTKLTFLYKSLL